LLGVRYLLQGSVRKEGNKLRILAQLVDDSGVQVWSNSFERELDNIFAIQSEVSDVVATTVVPKIVPPPHSQYQPDLVAYQFFLEGRELLHRRDSKARESLAEAARRDPNYPEAHAELAIALAINTPSAAALEQAQQAIDRALMLQPNLARTLAAQGLVLSGQRDPDLAAAELLFRQALERDPNMVDAMNWLNGVLSSHGRDVESDALLERALSIDPLHPSIAVNMADSYFERGDFERAEQMLLRLVELPTPPRYAFMGLRRLYMDLGRLIEMNAIEKKLALTGLHNYYGLAWNYAVLSDWASAAYWTERTRADFPTNPHAWVFPYIVPYWQGRYDEAAAIFQRALVSNNKSLSTLDAAFTYWDGTVRALAGDYQGAISALESVVHLRVDSDSDFDGHQALAWSYLRAGSPDKADALLQDIEREFAKLDERGRLHGSQDLFFFAQNAVLLGRHDLALDRLERAIDAGWRQYYIWRHDPRWAVLADVPRYVELMARVKADVDRQRVEVERLDAEEDFVAKLDAARR